MTRLSCSEAQGAARKYHRLAATLTSYDDQGEINQTQGYDPTTGSVSTNALTVAGFASHVRGGNHGETPIFEMFRS